jgi:hypothetical protein
MQMDFIQFNTTLARLVANPSDRAAVAACVCAQYTADCLSLPATSPDSLEGYYNTQAYVEEVVSILDPLNEKITMDLKLAKEYTKRLWMLRMMMVHPGRPERKKYAAQYGYFDTIMGVGLYVDEAQHQFVNQYKNEILSLYCDLCEIAMQTPTAGGTLQAQPAEEPVA